MRQVDKFEDGLMLERGVLQAPERSRDRGAMVTIRKDGGEGYAATADLSPSGLRAAAARALTWARHAANHPLARGAVTAAPTEHGSFESTVAIPWASVPLPEKIERLRHATRMLDGADLPVWFASFGYREEKTELLSSDGVQHHQKFCRFLPGMMLFAKSTDGGTVRRSLGRSRAGQAGLELLDSGAFDEVGHRLLSEVQQVATAPKCPEGVKDLLLAPDQMAIQIHESIGHPLELDRVLGDERNFAGTTFVTPEMVGSFQYGSALLNVTFDPGVQGELASYAYDDTGAKAERAHLIRGGVLKRLLGGSLSQARAGLPGVACVRASNWRRPPIDRMANLNVEPGDQTLAELIAQVEDGVYMETNLSWSIDDSRDKFQFSAEYGRRIRNGELAEVVQKAGYRGRSRAFWRSLKGVGRPDTFELHGTPYCGKGEPNQVVSVGHASPPCLFGDVELFGGN